VAGRKGGTSCCYCGPTPPVEEPIEHVQARVPKKNLDRPVKNGLSRRKTPPPFVDQWLLDREDAAPVNPGQDEETAPPEDSILLAREPSHMEGGSRGLPFFQHSSGYTLVGVSGVVIAGEGIAVLSENGSVVMETDEEPLIETQSDTGVLAPSRRTESPEVSLLLFGNAHSILTPCAGRAPNGSNTKS